MSVQLQVLGIAALLCVPVLALTVSPRFPRIVSSRRAQTAVAVGFTALIVLVTGWLVARVDRTALGSLASGVVILMLVAGMLGTALTQVFPLAGPLAYVLLAYTFPRASAVTETLRDLGVMSWIAALSVLGTLLWISRHKDSQLTSRAPLLIGAAFSAWIAVSIVAAVVSGRPLSPDLLIRSERYAQAAAIFLVAAVARPSLSVVRTLVLMVAVAVVVRQTVLTDSWFREQNLAMLATIMAPLAIAAALGKPVSVLQLPLALAGAYLAVMVLRIQNRGAIVGLFAGAAVAWCVARVRWQWSLAIGALLAIGAGGAFSAGLLDRFGEIYAHGQFLDTAASRLEIWSAGSEVAADHWLFGVGPGNFAVMASDQTGGVVTDFAHNTFVEVLTEMGIVGLVLYSGLFVITFQRIWTTSGTPLLSGTRLMLAGFAGALTSHLLAGSFLTNASLVLTWMLIGTLLAFMAGSSEVPLHRDEPRQDEAT